jgi:hypothetical protein
MNLMDIPGKDTCALLRVCGRQDAAEGIDKYTGWNKLREEMGFSDGRTPAMEAYLDGWYDPSVVRPEGATHDQY